MIYNDLFSLIEHKCYGSVGGVMYSYSIEFHIYAVFIQSIFICKVKDFVMMHVNVLFICKMNTL